MKGLSILLISVLFFSCGPYYGLKQKTILYEAGPIGGPGSPVGFGIINENNTSKLVFGNHSNVNIFKSRYGSSITVIWQCHRYEGKENSYVSITFKPTQYQGWVIENIYESDGICP